MKIRDLELSGLKIISHDIFFDDRGFFEEFYHQKKYEDLGIGTVFVQDNLNHSKKKFVVRGLHFQWDQPLTKLLRVVYGKVFAVAVDIRVDSPTFRRFISLELSDEGHESLLLPFGFAVGFCSLSERAAFSYKYSALYNPKGESNIRWNDPDLGITWPTTDPVLSEKDRSAQSFREWLLRPESQRFTMEASLRTIMPK